MIDSISRVWGADSIAVVFSSSGNFAPFTYTTILSLVDCSNKINKYDIIILETDMNFNQKKMFEQLIGDRQNISIRFYNVLKILSNYNLSTNLYWTNDCYVKLLIPDILIEYTKAIYLDSDMIIKDDIAILYNFDMKNASIGACRDPGIIARICVLHMNDEKHAICRKYINEKVCIKEKNLINFFCTATLLLNLDNIRVAYSSDDMMSYAMKNNFVHLDMDVFNSLFQDNVVFLPLEWGWAATNNDNSDYIGRLYPSAPRELYNEFISAGRNPKIIHYGGPNKPWIVIDRAAAEDFWIVFRRTPFYNSFIEQHLSVVQYKIMLSNYNKLNSAVKSLQRTEALYHQWIDRLAKTLPYRLLRRIF